MFQWSICQLLGEIADDSIWSVSTRQQAIELLGALYQNDQDWAQDDSVKSWMMTIIGKLSMTPDKAVKTTALALLQQLGSDEAPSAPPPYPLRSHIPIPVASPVLAKVQNLPAVEYHIYRVRSQRLVESRLPVYVAPMAKANIQAQGDHPFLLMDKVQSFLSDERQVMLILGDSGAGKSTFNHHLEYQLWSEYKRGGDIPLFINLPSIHEPRDDMVGKHLKTQGFSEAQIQELKDHRRLVVIGDGYDEMLSCRSQYIGQDYRSRFTPQGGDHYNRPAIHLFQEAVIEPFMKDQIQSYVKQYVPLEPRTWTTQDYMDKLNAIPNLVELVKNPFLLTLALEALPKVTDGEQDLSTINITRKQDGNPIVLYTHLIDRGSWKAAFFGPDPEVRLLQEATPLSRTGNQFRFIHRSMLKYFFSRTVFGPASHYHSDECNLQSDSASADTLVLGPDNPLFKRNLVVEPSVIWFLSERAQQHQEFKNILLAMVEQSKADYTTATVTAATNAITILVKAGVTFHGADLRGVCIPGADLSDGQFDSARFHEANLTDVNFA
ncbi:hypothetical protein BGW39_003543, partial [Mortierella sp. 14UC]